MPAQRRKAVGREIARSCGAAKKAHRCAVLPGPLERKCRLSRQTVPATAGWGLICRQPTKAENVSFFQLAKRLHRWPKQSSVDLIKLLVGHNWDLLLLSAATSLRILCRYILNSNRDLPNWPQGHAWTSSLRSTMKQVGFTETGVSWEWTHPRGGRIFLHSDFLHQNPEVALQHVLRAGWRHEMILNWQNSNRRDAVQCRDTPYQDATVDAMKKLPMNAHTLACLSGGFVSPQAYQVMTQTNQTCPYCGDGLATLQHVIWHCQANPHRPEDPPHDVLQARMSWPNAPNAVHNTKVLKAFTEARKACLEARNQC